MAVLTFRGTPKEASGELIQCVTANDYPCAKFWSEVEPVLGSRGDNFLSVMEVANKNKMLELGTVANQYTILDAVKL